MNTECPRCKCNLEYRGMSLDQGDEIHWYKCNKCGRNFFILHGRLLPVLKNTQELEVVLGGTK